MNFLIFFLLKMLAHVYKLIQVINFKVEDMSITPAHITNTTTKAGMAAFAKNSIVFKQYELNLFIIIYPRRFNDLAQLTNLLYLQQFYKVLVFHRLY